SDRTVQAWRARAGPSPSPRERRTRTERVRGERCPWLGEHGCAAAQRKQPMATVVERNVSVSLADRGGIGLKLEVFAPHIPGVDRPQTQRETPVLARFGVRRRL